MRVRPATAFPTFRISPGDTNKLALVVTPDDGADVTVVFEVWEEGGSQPPNRHPRSLETFLFLAGSGTAECDGDRRPVAAGDLLVLPAGTTHRIVNTGEGRLYALTTMVPDDGFAALIGAGIPDTLDGADLAVLGSHLDVSALAATDATITTDSDDTTPAAATTDSPATTTATTDSPAATTSDADTSAATHHDDGAVGIEP